MENLAQYVGSRLIESAHGISQFLGSWLGHRVETVIFALIILGTSFFVARLLSHAIDIPYRQLSGARLKDVHDAEKRQRRLKKLRAHKWQFVVWLLCRWTMIGFFAFVVPSIVLASGIYFYTWFVPNHEALAYQSGCNAWVAVKPDLGLLLSFMLSQFSMGFGHSLELLTYRGGSVSPASTVDPSNGVVAILLIGYRYFVAGFAAIFVRLFWRILVVFWATTPEEERLATIH